MRSPDWGISITKSSWRNLYSASALRWVNICIRKYCACCPSISSRSGTCWSSTSASPRLDGALLSGGRYRGRLVLEESSQPTAALAAVGMLGDDRPFGGLYKDPAITFESYLERLSAAASREGLEGDVAPDTRPHTAAPGDGGLGVGEGWGRRVEEDGLPVRGEGDPARAFEDDVEEAAREAAGALDPLYVPVDTGLEGEDVVAVDGHVVVLEIKDHDLALVLRQEQVARSVGRHQLDALACDGLLAETPKAPALVLEAYVALVGNHRA